MRSFSGKNGIALKYNILAHGPSEGEPVDSPAFKFFGKDLEEFRPVS
jgi:hypothetical protein